MIIQTRQILKLAALIYSALIMGSASAYATAIDTNAVTVAATETVFFPRLCQSETTDEEGKKGEEEEEPDCD